MLNYVLLSSSRFVLTISSMSLSQDASDDEREVSVLLRIVATWPSRKRSNVASYHKRQIIRAHEPPKQLKPSPVSCPIKRGHMRNVFKAEDSVLMASSFREGQKPDEHLVDSILSLSMKRAAASPEVVHQTRQLKPWLPWQTLDYVTKYETLPIRLLRQHILAYGYERDKRDRFAEEERDLYSRAYVF